MSTRGIIEIWDVGEELPTLQLYHHTDAGPHFMGPKLELFLRYIAKTAGLYPQRWLGEYVGAMFVKLSSDNDDGPVEPNTAPVETWLQDQAATLGVRALMPAFLPTCIAHIDIAYLWQVHLKRKGRPPWRIDCYAVRFDWDTGELIDREKVNWRKGARG